MKRLTFRVRVPDWAKQPIQEFVDDHDAVERFMTRRGMFTEDHLYFLTQVWGDASVYREGLESMGQVIEYDITAGTGDTFFALTKERRNDTESWFRELQRTHDVFWDHPSVYPVDGNEQRLHFIGEHGSLRRLLEAFPEDVPLSVERVEEYGRQAGGMSAYSSLTERQREAITAALDVGYYDVPRTGSTEDIAERLGCAPGTASTILRRAESRIVRWAADWHD